MFNQSQWPSSKSLQIINATKGIEKRGPSHTVGGNVNWCSHYGKHYEISFKKLKIELPYDPATPLLEKISYPEKTRTQKDTYTPGFTAALFTIPGHGSNLNAHRQMNG